MIFIDTGLIVAYANGADELHEKAVKIINDIDEGKYGTPAITDYIFDESMTALLARTRDFRLVLENGERLLNATVFLNYNIDSNLFSRTWKIFKNQRAPRLSFTDCSIIAVCEANGISTLATFDSHLKEESKLNIVD